VVQFVLVACTRNWERSLKVLRVLEGPSDEDDASSMLLPDETYEQGAVVAGHLLAMLRVYDDFLARYRIRPEFFCRLVPVTSSKGSIYLSNKKSRRREDKQRHFLEIVIYQSYITASCAIFLHCYRRYSTYVKVFHIIFKLPNK
jgi:hypothetical protein